MKGKYEIEIQSKRLKYKLEIKRNITIIKGNSATGKSTLIEMIQNFNTYGNESGISIKCDRKCIALTRYMWKELLCNIKNSIIFIDEGEKFIESKDFAHELTGNTNYFVLITRENLYNIPYSITEIYGLRETKRYGNTKQIYNETYSIYNKVDQISKITPEIIITEDSNSGYQFFSSVTNKKCISSNGNANIINTLKNNKYKGITLIIADGAALGPYMDAIMNYIVNSDNIILYAPESFEWLILQSGILQISNKIIDSTYDYVLSEKFTSWERFYTAVLVGITKDTQYKYMKSKLNSIFTSNRNKELILNTIKLINFK